MVGWSWSIFFEVSPAGESEEDERPEEEEIIEEVEDEEDEIELVNDSYQDSVISSLENLNKLGFGCLFLLSICVLYIIISEIFKGAR